MTELADARIGLGAAPHLLGRTMSSLMIGAAVGAPSSLAVAGAALDVDATALFVGAGVMVLATALAGFATSLPDASSSRA